MIFYPRRESNIEGTKYTDYSQYKLIVYKPWVLNVNTIWSGADEIDEVMHDTWGGSMKETHDAGNIFLDILCRYMDS